MSNDRCTLQKSSWLDCCPWMMIFRTFSLSINAQSLFIAAIGVMFTLGVWNVSEMIFISEEDSLTEQVNGGPPVLRAAVSEHESELLDENLLSPPEYLKDRVTFFLLTHPFVTVSQQLVGPFARLFDNALKITELAHNLCGGLLTLLIWSIAGGAITRSTIVRVACEQRVGLTESIMFALRKLGAYFSAPIFPLLGVLLVALPIILLGFFTKLPWGIGFFLAGPFWIFVLLGGLLMSVMLLGLLFGWPLMWSTISAEGTDAFDALSRSYAYSFQRPLHYIFYGIVAWFLGLLGWILVYFFSESVITLSQQAASWGNSSLLLPLADSQAQHLEYIGRWFISCWLSFVRVIATGFSFSFFWCSASIIYLLLRRETDQTETDEVFLDDEPAADDLPTLETDSAGVPSVSEEVSETVIEESTPGEHAASEEETRDDRPTDLGG